MPMKLLNLDKADIMNWALSLIRLGMKVWLNIITIRPRVSLMMITLCHMKKFIKIGLS